jgi:hypothetical protein
MFDPRGRGKRVELRDFMLLRKFYNHIPAFSVQRRVRKEVWNSYYKFCIERNPWDKSLSHYHMISDRSKSKISLDQYLNNGEFCLNYPKYTDKAGKLILDRVIKYENLVEELGQVFEELKVPFSGNLGVNAKSEHRKDKASYQEVFNKQQEQLISKIFEKEISMYGYSFYG